MPHRCRAWRRVVAFVAALAPAVGLLTAMSASPAHAAGRKISAWIPYWDQGRAYNAFLANADLYDEALPFWYEMQSAGSISAYQGGEDPTVASGIKAKGVRVVPTVTNNFDPARVETMLGSGTSRTTHVNALVNLVMSKGYDGVDVDYENLLAGDRSNFSAFVSELASALHANGKVLDIAVYAKTSEPGTWDGPQAEDYAAIGRAADRVQVMAYDYHWSTSAAGPVAPLPWVDQVSAFAASQISPSKVQLGMNVYGYDWVGANGDGQMWDALEARRTANGATRNWDATNAESWFTYSAGGSVHTVWYGDSQSVGARLPVVEKYGLGGAVFWHLAGEDPAVWTTVRARWGGTGTPTATLPAPTGVTAKAVSRSRIRVSWSPVVGAKSYRLLKSSTPAGPYVLLGTTTGTSATSSGLIRRTTYYYVVQAVNGAGTSSSSAPASATTF
jgi:spore germination protein